MIRGIFGSEISQIFNTLTLSICVIGARKGKVNLEAILCNISFVTGLFIILENQ